MRIALATSMPRRAASVAIQDAFATGAAISAWRSSWKPPRPSWVVSVWPDSSTTGDSCPSAVISAAVALAWPGPPVTMARPGRPVSRPKASAACTAAASWRVCTRSSREPIAASNSDMMWLPDRVKSVVCPARSSVRTTMSAPRVDWVILSVSPAIRAIVRDSVHRPQPRPGEARQRRGWRREAAFSR